MSDKQYAVIFVITAIIVTVAVVATPSVEFGFPNQPKTFNLLIR